MSRIIELSNTVIKQPELLIQAVTYLNDLKNYGVINAKYQQDKNGRILSGSFHLQTEDKTFGRGNVFLRYEGLGEPAYDIDGILKSGHFRLLGDEDFKENKTLGTLLADHYNAQVVKNHFESLGQRVHIELGSDGAITIESEETETLAACSY
jgi:hypothetical protein